jgi:hypothetical protein
MTSLFRSSLPPDPQLVATLERLFHPDNLWTFARVVLGWLLVLFLIMVVVALGEDAHPLDLLGRTWGWPQWLALCAMPLLWLALGWLPEQYRYRSLALLSVTLLSGYLGYQLLVPRALRVQSAAVQSWISPQVWYALELVLGAGVLLTFATIGVTVLQYQPNPTLVGRLMMTPCWLRDSLITVLGDLAATPYKSTAVLLVASATLIAGMAWARTASARALVSSATQQGQRVLRDSAVVGKAVVIDGPERSLSRKHQMALSSQTDVSGAWTWEATFYLLSRQQPRKQGVRNLLVAQLASPRAPLVRIWWLPQHQRFGLWTYADQMSTPLLWPLQRWTRLTVQFRATTVELWLDEELVWTHPVHRSMTTGDGRPEEEWTWELPAPEGIFGYVRNVQMYPHANVVFGQATARE